jgi:hypothetical protein
MKKRNSIIKLNELPLRQRKILIEDLAQVFGGICAPNVGARCVYPEDCCTGLVCSNSVRVYVGDDLWSDTCQTG